MNSCRNWHCCCHTIIPKRRRQDTFRQFKPADSNSQDQGYQDNIEKDADNEDQKDGSCEPSHKMLKPDTVKFENADEDDGIENGEFGEESSFTHSVSDSECNENGVPTEIYNDNNADDLADVTTEDSSEDAITAELEPAENKANNSPDVILTDSKDTRAALETDIEQAVKKEDSVEVAEIENREDFVKDEPTAVDGVIGTIEEGSNSIKCESDSISKELKLKVRTTSHVTKPEIVEAKDKEQPTPTTSNPGSSTGRYNCRNREKFHKCLKCGKMFFQLDTFVRHEKEHLLEETKPCYCTVCNRSYTSMSSLSKHLKTHITCVQCNKIFSQAEVGKVSPGGQNYHCSDCKKHSSPQPPVLQPEGDIKVSEVVKSKPESTNNIPANNGTTVYARKSTPVFVEKKSEPVTTVKKVTHLGLQSSHLKVTKDQSNFLKCNECDRRFPNLTTLKNHRTLHANN